MKFYIGYDSSQEEAALVCAKSISKWISKEHIQFLKTDELRNAGLYWRTHDGTESTDFAYTRFLVPFLSGYSGYSVFCDCDFLWRTNPMELMFHQKAHEAVCVVKHDITPDMLLSTKMNGKIQKWYPRKNWSSLMLFNNSHYDCTKLAPASVSLMSPSWLHGFEWTDINETESLPKRYNHLVGYYPVDDSVAAVHFTDGGPWIRGYEDVDYSEEWRRVQSQIQPTMD